VSNGRILLRMLAAALRRHGATCSMILQECTADAPPDTSRVLAGLSVLGLICRFHRYNAAALRALAFESADCNSFRMSSRTSSPT